MASVTLADYKTLQGIVAAEPKKCSLVGTLTSAATFVPKAAYRLSSWAFSLCFQSQQEVVVHASKEVELKKLYQTVRSARTLLEHSDRDSLPNLLARLPEIHKEAIENLHHVKKSYDLTHKEWIETRAWFTRSWVDIDHRVSKMAGRYLHFVCGCQLSPEVGGLGEKATHVELPDLTRAARILSKTIPFKSTEYRSAENDPLHGKIAWIPSHDCGGGHEPLRQSLAQRLATAGAHVFYGDGPEGVLLHLDALHPTARKLGAYLPCTDLKELTGYAVARWALRTGNFWIFKVMGSKYGRPPEETMKLWVRLFREEMQSLDIDIAAAAYARHDESLSLATAQAGLPMYFSATDYDSSATGVKRGERENGNRHMRLGTYLDIDSAANKRNGVATRMLETLKRHPADGQGLIIDREKVVHGGLTIDDEFLREYGPELRGQYKIHPDAQVVLILGGGGTSNSSEMFDIAKDFEKYHSKSAHLFKVCGSNKEALRGNLKLFTAKYGKPEVVQVDSGGKTYEFHTFTQGRHKYSVVGFLGRQAMVELLNLTILPNRNSFDGFVISTKAGGGTLREVHAVGARMMIRKDDSISGWEVVNRKIMEDAGLAISYDEKRLPETMKGFLAKPQDGARRQEIAECRQLAKESRELFLNVMRDLIVKSSADEEFSSRRLSVNAVERRFLEKYGSREEKDRE